METNCQEAWRTLTQFHSKALTLVIDGVSAKSNSSQYIVGAGLCSTKENTYEPLVLCTLFVFFDLLSPCH